MKKITLNAISFIVLLTSICNLTACGGLEASNSSNEIISQNDISEIDKEEIVEENNIEKKSENTKGDLEVEKFVVEKAAYESFSNFIEEYYFQSKVKNYGLFLKLNYWDQAEIYEIVIDAYEHTGDQRYYKMIYDIYEGFTMTHGEDWSWNEFNDDIMWMTIACTRAYFATGDVKFLNTAIKHFDIVWDRGWSEDLGGGIFWRIENTTKNACINCPATIAACLLAEATGNEDYYEKAVKIENWVVNNIYEEDTGHVYDAYEMNGHKSTWASTYNQGTFIGANTLLYLHYKDGIYLSRARAAADYTIEKMYNMGIMNNEESGGDLIGFKGILARWMYCFAMNCNQPDVLEWLEKNGEAAWDNRNSNGIMSTQFARKTLEGEKIPPFSASSPVSVLNNCRSNKHILKSLDKVIELNDFTRCERMLISEEEEKTIIKAVADEAYLVYTSVKLSKDDTNIGFKFGTENDIDVELRLDKWDGEVLAQKHLSNIDEAQEVFFEINTKDMSGRHNIYLVIKNKDKALFY